MRPEQILIGTPASRRMISPLLYAITGELVHRAAVPVHHRRSAVDQLGHDFAQPLGPYSRRDIHRVHHVGEQHGHLLVLRPDTGVFDW